MGSWFYKSHQMCAFKDIVLCVYLEETQKLTLYCWLIAHILNGVHAKKQQIQSNVVHMCQQIFQLLHFLNT